MWAAIALPIIQTGAAQLNKPNAQDASRFAQARTWYSAAIAGDNDALAALQYMGGLRNCANVAGVVRCGFATDAAKMYTEELYQQATRVRAGAMPASSALPSPPGSTPNAVGSTIQQVAEVTSAVATGLGQPPRVPVTASATSGQWLLIGAVAIVGVVLLMKFAR